MSVRLLQVSAFYRNDQPDGIGVTITEQAFTVPLVQVIDEIMGNYWKMWIEAEEHGTTEELVSDLVAQLKRAGKIKGHLEISDAV